MEDIRRALIVSIFSKGWAAALSLLAIPWYLRFIGVEAYGVVGLFTSLCIVVGFLDLGLGATLTRELARASGQSTTLADSRDLLRTFELTYALIALLIGLVIAACSAPLAHHWVQAQTLPRAQIAQALALAGFALACQWPSNLYGAGLAGVHRQAQLGFATVVLSTTRVALTIGALAWYPSLTSFFLAQALGGLLQTLCLRWLLWRALALAGHRPKLRLLFLQSSFQFASGMTGITITSIILTQTDKLILSAALSLADFGAYVVAATLATGLYIVISPMFAVMYPRFSALTQEHNKAQLIKLYHTSSQAMAVLVIPLALVLAGFSQQVLYLWTADKTLSHHTALILALLIGGNAINGLMNMPYALQLAHGWTSLALGINLALIVALIPMTWWAASQYGAAGAALVWLLLNFACIVLVPSIMHKNVLPGQKLAWYQFSVVIPVAISASAVLVAGWLGIGTGKVQTAMTLLVLWLTLTIITALVLPKTREIIKQYLDSRLYKKSQ